MGEHLKLEGKFKERVQEVVRYTGTIEDFDELVDSWTLAYHCLGPEPSLYVLRVINREERKSG